MKGCLLLTILVSASCRHGGDSRPAQTPDLTHTEPTSTERPQEGGQSIQRPPNGALAPEVIQKIVRSNFDRMRACYEAGLRRNPNLRGKVSTRFIIEPDGRVSSAYEVHDAPAAHQQDHTEEPRLPDEAVVACIVATFAAMNFPEPKGGTVTAIYPIIFSPEDGNP